MTDAPKKLAGHHLLVVEDEYFIAEDIRQDFEHAGALVLGPVASVDAALHVIDAAERIDGAVLDVNLRNTLVFPVADALTARGIPFIFATGYEASRIPARFKAVKRCRKPIDPGILAQVLGGDPALSLL